MFKVGDRVRCISAPDWYTNPPKIGHTYRVDQVDDGGGFHLREENGLQDDYFETKDFILVSDTMPKSNCGRFSNSSL